MTDELVIPNHHHDYPGFAGLGGLVAALSMVGRGGDARWAATLARLQAGDAVVDIGCGPGTAARYAARRGATVTGVDPAKVMLRMARVLTRSRRARYQPGSAEQLPIADASATVVWSIASVHHWRDLDAALREVRRVLRPSGRFVAIEKATRRDASGLSSHGWTDEQAAAFAQRCIDAGFETVRTERDEAGSRGRTLVAVVANLAS